MNITWFEKKSRYSYFLVENLDHCEQFYMSIRRNYHEFWLLNHLTWFVNNLSFHEFYIVKDNSISGISAFRIIYLNIFIEWMSEQLGVISALYFLSFGILAFCIHNSILQVLFEVHCENNAFALFKSIKLILIYHSSFSFFPLYIDNVRTEIYFDIRQGQRFYYVSLTFNFFCALHFFFLYLLR